jgi:hypothetical protein
VSGKIFLEQVFPFRRRLDFFPESTADLFCTHLNEMLEGNSNSESDGCNPESNQSKLTNQV